jgi:hypothetical protein
MHPSISVSQADSNTGGMLASPWYAALRPKPHAACDPARPGDIQRLYLWFAAEAGNWSWNVAFAGVTTSPKLRPYKRPSQLRRVLSKTQRFPCAFAGQVWWRIVCEYRVASEIRLEVTLCPKNQAVREAQGQKIPPRHQPSGLSAGCGGAA